MLHFPPCIFSFAAIWLKQILLSPMVLATFWFGFHFVMIVKVSLPSFNFIKFQFVCFFYRFQCCNVNIGEHQFSPFVKYTTRHRRHDALQCAHVQKVSVCVMHFAPPFGTKNRAFSECSKHVMFSITFGLRVRQPTVCVTFWAHCRCAPPSLLGDHLDTWAPEVGVHGRPCGTWATMACHDFLFSCCFVASERLDLLKVLFLHL